MAATEPSADQQHAPDSETTLHPTAPVLGSYRLLQRLGTGGMATVFRAEHVTTGHEFAVKILPRELGKKEVALQRFLKEARNLESLDHPNVVTLFDRGFDHDRHYLVFEYVDGGDLHVLVKQHGPLEVSEALEVVRKVADALRHAASRGLIHRDIKPSNILVTSRGVIKLADLGLAVQAELEDDRLTREGTTVGTVDYMPPEQARDSRSVTIRSDIYSLGCTFYYLLAGEPPFPMASLTDKIRAHALAPVPDVRTIRPEVPKAISLLIQRMMAKDQDKRFESYDRLLKAVAKAEKSANEPKPPDSWFDSGVKPSDDPPATTTIPKPTPTPPAPISAPQPSPPPASSERDVTVHSIPKTREEHEEDRLDGISLKELLDDTPLPKRTATPREPASPLRRQQYRRPRLAPSQGSRGGGSRGVGFQPNPEHVLFFIIALVAIVLAMWLLIRKVIAPVPDEEGPPLSVPSRAVEARGEGRGFAWRYVSRETFCLSCPDDACARLRAACPGMFHVEQSPPIFTAPCLVRGPRSSELLFRDDRRTML